MKCTIFVWWSAQCLTHTNGCCEDSARIMVFAIFSLSCSGSGSDCNSICCSDISCETLAGSEASLRCLVMGVVCWMQGAEACWLKMLFGSLELISGTTGGSEPPW
jgi:hypothetical protein